MYITSSQTDNVFNKILVPRRTSLFFFKKYRLIAMGFFIKVFILVVFTLGCKSTLKEPENIDPIYSDFLKKAKEAESSLKSQKDAVKKAKGEWEKSAPQTGEAEVNRNQYFIALKKADALAQRAQYLKLRAESRRIAARQQYVAALEPYASI